METNLRNNEFNAQMLLLGEKFVYLYSLSPEKFTEAFKHLPLPLKEFFFHLYDNRPYDETTLQDTQDLLLEVFHYYFKPPLKKKTKDDNKNKYEEFTLRNNNHLEEFNEFLDKMIKLLEVNPEKFLELFPQCPPAYWDKIDDLRETSFKSYRDSDAYTSCLAKCKKLSFEFEKLKSGSEAVKEDQLEEMPFGHTDPVKEDESEEDEGIENEK
jgi:hypothetical protein